MQLIYIYIYLTLMGSSYFTCFTDEETEIKEAKQTCSMQQSQSKTELDSIFGVPDYNTQAPYFYDLFGPGSCTELYHYLTWLYVMQFMLNL